MKIVLRFRNIMVKPCHFPQLSSLKGRQFEPEDCLTGCRRKQGVHVNYFKNIMKTAFFTLFLILMLFGCSKTNNNPNIVWIVAEDITTMLGCYGDPNANTPNLDAFAEKSVKFTNAFATAPVCAPSRSCIITGEYSTSLGSQHLRSEVKIPSTVTPFPKYLKEAGYYVTNNDKEDYNFVDTTMWHESSKKAHWKNRKEGQPFFSVFNIGITHQSGIFGDDSTYQERISKYISEIKTVDPESLKLAPYFPDSPTIRKLWARYYTNIQVMDLQFAERLIELDEAGLLDETIVFYYSDHGTGMPRAKRALYDSGLRIPLLVYMPEKYAGKFNLKPGTTNDRMVSFLDFAPTILELTGITIPESLNGSPFISENDLNENDYVFGTSDRVDEAYEMARTIRTKKYRYVRNFLSYTPLLQPNFYSDKSEIMKELNKFRNAEDLTAAQQTLFQPKRQPEELYDVRNDPHEVNNLDNNPEYKSVLSDMRGKLRQEILESFDTGLMPEPEMTRLAENSTPFESSKNQEVFPVAEILDACDLVIKSNVSADEILQKLKHKNGFVRYWAIVSVESLENYQPEILNQLKKMINDDFNIVQIEAAKTLIKAGKPQYVNNIINHLENKDVTVQLFAARAFEETWQLLPEFPDKVYEIYENFKKSTAGKWYGHDLYAFWSLSQVFKDEKIKAPVEVNYGK